MTDRVRVILIGSYYHSARFRCTGYIWLSVLIWAFDRALRFVRVVYFNYFKSERGARMATSSELVSPRVVQLRISSSPQFSWKPGQTVFLILPTISPLPIEAHPFTIASIDTRYDINDVTPPVPRRYGAVDNSELTSNGAGPAAPCRRKQLLFFIDVHERFTKQLAARAAAGEPVRLLVDGPYGAPPNLDADDAVVLVAGGSGVACTLPTLLGVLARVRRGASRCRRLLFVWSTHDAGECPLLSPPPRPRWSSGFSASRCAGAS